MSTAVTLAIALALAALGCGAFAFTRPNIVHAAALVMAALLLLAAAMLALSAGFAAALMILVHAGAIVAMLLFIAVSTPAGHARPARLQSVPRAAILLVPLALVLMLGVWLADLPGGLTRALPPPLKAVGEVLFGPWAAGVELASLLLLVALLGARQLLRREPEDRA